MAELPGIAQVLRNKAAFARADTGSVTVDIDDWDVGKWLRSQDGSAIAELSYGVGSAAAAAILPHIYQDFGLLPWFVSQVVEHSNWQMFGKS